MTMTLIYKIAPGELWRAAEARGVFEGAPIDLADGFIHLSAADQVRETARLYFAGQEDLVLVAIEAEPFGAALKWETSRGGALFPHLFGALATADVVSVQPLPRGPDGAHLFPAEIP
jgi:uncharacterized protein (DUF952 family)